MSASDHAVISAVQCSASQCIPPSVRSSASSSSSSLIDVCTRTRTRTLLCVQPQARRPRSDHCSLPASLSPPTQPTHRPPPSAAMSFFDEVETTVANTRFLQAQEDTGAIVLPLKPRAQLDDVEGEQQQQQQARGRCSTASGASASGQHRCARTPCMPVAAECRRVAAAVGTMADAFGSACSAAALRRCVCCSVASSHRQHRPAAAAQHGRTVPVQTVPVHTGR